jgi:uncharacterized protein
MSAGDWKDLYKAACEGDLALVKHHVDAGVDLNYAHPEFFSTPLVGAIRARQEEVALFMLEHGADPNLMSEMDAMTPLQAARQCGLAGVEARLRSLGAHEPAAPPRSWRRWWPFTPRRGG